MGILFKMLARFTRLIPTTCKLNKSQALVRCFSGDKFDQKGTAEENLYFRKKNQKKVQAMMAKIQAQLEDTIDDVNVDDVLEDREWLAAKLRQRGIEDEALVKELLAWKHGSY